MADLYDNFLNSVDAVATKVVSELNYNKTLLCTIVEIQDDRYIVTDSSTKFEAFSSTEDVYGVGEVVYVLVPNGDNEEKKWIIKSVGTAEDDGYEEVDPVGAFEDIKFSYESRKKYSLLANGASQNLVLYNSAEIVDTKETYFLCLSADFNVSIPKAEEGDYGIRLTINTIGKEGPQVYELSNTYMTGNVYSQNHTQAIFDTIPESHFIGYKLELYQKGNFTYTNGNTVTYKGMSNEDYTNIKVSNICFYIGESSSIVDEFSKIHFSQMKNNSGVIIGKKQNAAGIFGYDKKKLIASLGPEGKSVLGSSNLGQIVADEDLTILEGNFDFNIINSDKDEVIYSDKDDEKIHFKQVRFENKSIEMSKKNFEKNVFRKYFDIIEGESGPLSKTNTIYYINGNGKDSNDGKTPGSSFLTLNPIRSLCNNGLKNFTIYFLSNGGKYNLEFLNGLSGINCFIITNGRVNFYISRDISIYNSSLYFLGEINIVSANSLNIRLGCLEIKNGIINLPLNIEGSSINIEDSYINQLNMNNAKGELKDSIVNRVKTVNTEINFISCTLKTKERLPFTFINSTIGFNNLRVEPTEEGSFIPSLITLYGGKISLNGEIESTLGSNICKNFIYNFGGAIISKKENMENWKSFFGDNVYGYITINNGEKEVSVDSEKVGDYQKQWEDAGCPKITKQGGVNFGPSGHETYYNLKMNGCVQLMRNLGYSEEIYNYWERDDGCKMFGKYIMVAADLSIRPKGTILPCSLGMAMVCDTGTFVNRVDGIDGHHQLDIAVNW